MFSLYWRVLIRPNFRKILLVAFASLLSGLADVATMSLIIPIVALFSNVETQDAHQFTLWLEIIVKAFGLALTPSALLSIVLTVLILLAAVKLVLVAGLNYLTAYISQDTKSKLTAQMFRAFLNTTYAEIAARHRGKIVQDIQSPPDGISYVIFAMGGSLAAAARLMTTLVFLVWLSPSLTLLVMLIGGATAGLLRLYLQGRVASLGRVDYSASQINTSIIVDSIDGMRVVKGYHLIDRMVERLQVGLRQRLQTTTLLLVFSQIPQTLFETIGVFMVAVMVFAVQWVPFFSIDFPKLATYVVALRQLLPSASQLNTTLLNMAQYWRQIEVIDSVISHLPQEDSRQGHHSIPPKIHSLHMNKISFTYPEDLTRDVLKDVSLTFSQGRTIALVGATGSGKTTLADIISRLREPNSGSVMVNGIDIREFGLEEWREQIGYVSQDIFLFNATLAENITAFDPHFDHEAICFATKLAQIHDFIESLPDGYQTQVGDRGLKLSGGQRQRIAVARALLRRPRILILDEATSALDNLTERAMHDAINLVRRETIVIIIAHRLSTVEDVDEIVVLEGGGILERGTHDDLLKRGGLYTQLYGATHLEPISKPHICANK